MMLILITHGAYIIGQNTKYVYVIYQNQVIDSFVTGTRPVPNYLTIFGDTFLVVNSGGFSGDGSLAFINNKNVIYELFLPNYMNPMQAVRVNNKIYFTDFGDVFNDKIYIVQGFQIIDSITVYKRPSAISYCFGYIYATSTGINSDYSYDDSSFVHKINPDNNIVLNLRLRSNSNGVKCDGQYVYVMTSGTYDNNFNPLNNSAIYKIDPNNFVILDSTRNLQNVSAFAIGNNYILAGVWKFDSVLIYKINKNDFNEIDSFKLNYGGLGDIDFDGQFFKISLGGFTSGPNAIYVLDESNNNYYYFVHHSNDVGSGFIKGFISLDVVENVKPFYIRNNVLYVKSEDYVKIYDISGKIVLSTKNNVISLKSLKPGLYVVSIGNKNYKIVLK
ncbi:MAG: T9SS type A sorting domain-containing protein [candidate division WOR-3 bacterium]